MYILTVFLPIYFDLCSQWCYSRSKLMVIRFITSITAMYNWYFCCTTFKGNIWTKLLHLWVVYVNQLNMNAIHSWQRLPFIRYCTCLGPMKGVIPTPDIVKIFHPTPDIQAKKCPTPTLKIHPDTRHPPSKRWKMQKTCRKCILSFGGDYIPSRHSTLWFLSRHPKLQNIWPRHSTLTPPFKGPIIGVGLRSIGVTRKHFSTIKYQQQCKLVSTFYFTMHLISGFFSSGINNMWNNVNMNVTHENFLKLKNDLPV